MVGASGDVSAVHMHLQRRIHVRFLLAAGKEVTLASGDTCRSGVGSGKHLSALPYVSRQCGGRMLARATCMLRSTVLQCGSCKSQVWAATRDPSPVQQRHTGGTSRSACRDTAQSSARLKPGQPVCITGSPSLHQAPQGMHKYGDRVGLQRARCLGHCSGPAQVGAPNRGCRAGHTACVAGCHHPSLTGVPGRAVNRGYDPLHQPHQVAIPPMNLQVHATQLLRNHHLRATDLAGRAQVRPCHCLTQAHCGKGAAAPAQSN